LFRGHLGQITSRAKARILRSLGGLVSANGYLVLGCNENPGDTSFWFDPVSIAHGCFKRRDKQVEIPEPEPAPEIVVEEAPQPAFVPVEYQGNGTA